MIDNPYVLALLILVVGGVLCFALYRGYNIKLRKGDNKASFERSTEDSPDVEVSVGQRAEIKGEVGNVTGVRTSDPAAAGSVGVLDDATIDEHGKVGDIVGVDQSAPRPGESKE